jgi:cytidylate kinase
VAEPLILTLDGPAGVGKSTVAKLLAKRLGLAFLDTGAMFRAVAWRLGKDSWTWPEECVAEQLKDLRFGLAGAGEATRLDLEEVFDAILAAIVQAAPTP